MSLPYDWEMYEKIDGANIGFVMKQNESEIKIRSRAQESDIRFFGFTEIADKYMPKIAECLKLLQTQYPDANQIILFGELFGGSVRKQSGTYGSKQVRMFDIRLDNPNRVEYLPMDVIHILFDKFDIEYVVPIATGSLLKLLEYPLEFETGYCNSETANTNKKLAEGYVIRPILSENQVVTESSSRLILKYKLKDERNITRQKTAH